MVAQPIYLGVGEKLATEVFDVSTRMSLVVEGVLLCSAMIRI
ncbi:MAG: hypothetical protein WBA93_17775 [Microcoleaceae cyanobacterium]